MRPTSGFAALMVSIRAATASARVTSLAPFARRILKPTTGMPSKRAKVRGSAIVSVMSPRSSNRTSPPAGRAILVAPRSATVLAPARVRMAWSRPPISARPPARSTLLPRSWRLTSSGVKPTDCSRTGSSPTRISRSTLPMRSTRATPRTPCNARMTTSSTNQESCSGVFPGAIAAYVRIGRPAISTR